MLSEIQSVLYNIFFEMKRYSRSRFLTKYLKKRVNHKFQNQYYRLPLTGVQLKIVRNSTLSTTPKLVILSLISRHLRSLTWSMRGLQNNDEYLDNGRRHHHLFHPTCSFWITKQLLALGCQHGTSEQSFFFQYIPAVYF